MWTIGDDEPEDAPKAPSRPDCPGCGAPDLHGDDFCHECGFSFEHLNNQDADSDEDSALGGIPCPTCESGTLVMLEYGRTQCDSCGYTARDEG